MGDLYVDKMNHFGQLLYFAVSYFSFRELQETFSLLNLGRNFAGMVDVLKGNWGRRNIILSLFYHYYHTVINMARLCQKCSSMKRGQSIFFRRDKDLSKIISNK